MPQGTQLIFLVLLLGLLFITFQRGSRQRREMAAVQAGLAPGSRVMTSSGLYATVVAVEGDVVTLETGPGQQSRWDRRAVLKVLPDQAAEPATEPGSDLKGDQSAADASTQTPQNITHPDETTPPGPA